jgi:hypothetical protein
VLAAGASALATVVGCGTDATCAPTAGADPPTILVKDAVTGAAICDATAVVTGFENGPGTGPAIEARAAAGASPYPIIADDGGYAPLVLSSLAPPKGDSPSLCGFTSSLSADWGVVSAGVAGGLLVRVREQRLRHAGLPSLYESDSHDAPRRRHARATSGMNRALPALLLRVGFSE